MIVLHGNTQTGADMVTRTAWPMVAKREGFAVVFPDGLNHSWADLRPNKLRAGRVPPHGTDDVAFIAKLVEKFVADGSIDAKRIYVTGISKGGAMTMTLICKRADLFAAAASVIMNLTDAIRQSVPSVAAVPMLMMNGTADPLVPYKGGRGTSRYAVDGFWSARRRLASGARPMAARQRMPPSPNSRIPTPPTARTVTRIDSRLPCRTRCRTLPRQ